VTLRKGDRLLVSELSRLGRSLGQILQIVERLIQQGVGLVAIKEGVVFEGKQTMQTKAMIALFGLFAEVERDLIAERPKEGLAAARAKGQQLGRPNGALGKSRLDGKEQEIRLLLQKRVSKASLARILDVSPTTLHHFVKTRNLHPQKRRRAYPPPAPFPQNGVPRVNMKKTSLSENPLFAQEFFLSLKFLDQRSFAADLLSDSWGKRFLAGLSYPLDP